jgi:hypothetical protein
MRYVFGDHQLSLYRSAGSNGSGFLVQRGDVKWVSGCEFLYRVSFDSSGVNRLGWVYRFSRR